MRSAPRTADSPIPNFLIVGAMKAGTTSLYHYLSAHPQVYMSPIKELDFFVEHANWKRGMAWYRRQFDGAGRDAVAIGEASTTYTKYPAIRGVPQRVATCLPGVRLIYVVRDPIERIRSHYQHRVAVGSETAPLDEAVFRNPIYVACSRYALQVEQYLEYFPRDALFLITSEDLRNARRATVRRTYEFLGVDGSYLPEVLEEESYRTTGRAHFSPAAWRIRRTLKRYLPVTKRAKEFMDSRLPRPLTRILDRRQVGTERATFDLSDHLRSQIAELLRDDVRRLRSYMPDGFDGWGILSRRPLLGRR